jgi:hypothetical protein
MGVAVPIWNSMDRHAKLTGLAFYHKPFCPQEINGAGQSLPRRPGHRLLPSNSMLQRKSTSPSSLQYKGVMLTLSMIDDHPLLPKHQQTPRLVRGLDPGPSATQPTLPGNASCHRAVSEQAIPSLAYGPVAFQVAPAGSLPHPTSGKISGRFVSLRVSHMEAAARGSPTHRRAVVDQCTPSRSAVLMCS